MSQGPRVRVKCQVKVRVSNCDYSKGIAYHSYATEWVGKLSLQLLGTGFRG